MTEPTTEAGLRHEDYCRTFMGDDSAKDILAIEAEARADAHVLDAQQLTDAYRQGRADALRDAAERVRALYTGNEFMYQVRPNVYMALVETVAVLAILDPEAAP